MKPANFPERKNQRRIRAQERLDEVLKIKNLPDHIRQKGEEQSKNTKKKISVASLAGVTTKKNRTGTGRLHP
jgi:ABC-type multidrug transport system ATPase subunit